MARSTTRVRSGLVGLLFVLACISLVLSTIAVWAHQTLLVTDRFVAVTSRVVDEPAVPGRRGGSAGVRDRHRGRCPGPDRAACCLAVRRSSRRP